MNIKIADGYEPSAETIVKILMGCSIDDFIEQLLKEKAPDYCE